MDVESYDSLFKRIKDSLIYSFDMSQNVFIASHISSALEECNSCVSKSLELGRKLLEETNFQVNKLCDYIDNANVLLQMLSDFIKNVLESAAMACCNMKPFPTTTGNIILTVFMHCKDSACIYGNHLKSVETQLKDLFRTCHELQLTYLMTLEKHFIFDLSEKEEQDILIEALNINMRIGEIVQALDIKTMAEQWKAYTVICEKYSNFLLDKNICNKCFHLFATIIIGNIKVALEPDQDNKSVLRSLKVANFTIKILSRISNVFKHAVTNNYEHVVELMEYVYLHNPAYLDLSAEKSQQFINLMLTNILNPTDALCNILLDDERFLDYVYKIDVNELDSNTFLGYTILVTSIIKAVVVKKEDQVLNLDKQKVIDCVYRILPLGHFWFNMDLRFQSKDCNNCSLYEHLLVHVVALAITFSPQQYALLEKCMYEAILATDCYTALFSTNLWALLVRISTDHLASNTLSSLINIYQKLEKHSAFRNSPQQVHLSYTIGKMFEVSSSEDKKSVYSSVSKQIRPQNALWSVLKVSNLPGPLRRNIEAGVLENFKISCQELFESEDISEGEIDNLIQIMKVTATCSSLETDDVIEQYIVKLWSKVCHKNEYIRTEDCGTSDTAWFFRYLDALVSLTDCVRDKLDSASVGTILHNMSTLLYHCGTEIIVLIFDLFCKLTFNRVDDENRYVIDNIFKDTLKVLLQIENAFTKQYLLSALSEDTYNGQFYNITSKLLYDGCLGKELDMDFKSKSKSVEWKQELLSDARFQYIHQCVRIPSDNCKGRSERIVRSKTSNFDIGDFLFDESEEPSRKKAKLDLNEADSLVERLENDTLLLCQVEDSALDNYKKRITDVIDKLRNIVS